jgi:hypothetical protein
VSFGQRAKVFFCIARNVVYRDFAATFAMNLPRIYHKIYREFTANLLQIYREFTAKFTVNLLQYLP